MYSEPTELRLTCYLTESTWTQKILIKFVDTKNQLSDMLTKGKNVTRDVWNHHLHLFNIMSFSFSCSQFSNFLSNPIRKQSAMSKRGQETTSR